MEIAFHKNRVLQMQIQAGFSQFSLQSTCKTILKDETTFNSKYDFHGVSGNILSEYICFAEDKMLPL